MMLFLFLRLNKPSQIKMCPGEQNTIIIGEVVAAQNVVVLYCGGILYSYSGSFLIACESYIKMS